MSSKKKKKNFEEKRIKDVESNYFNYHWIRRSRSKVTEELGLKLNWGSKSLYSKEHDESNYFNKIII